MSGWRWLARGGRFGWHKPPAPGPVNPPRAFPAPGQEHGGISYSVRVWNCGRTRIWDGDGKVTFRHDCKCVPGCSLCSWHRAYDPVRGWVRVLEICPAHADHQESTR